MDETLKCGTSITNQEQSRTTKIRVGLGTLQVVEDPPTCRLTTPTLDGGNSSSMTAKTHSTMSRTTRFSMLLEAKTKKLPTFRSGRRMALLLRNGLLCMKTKRRKNKPRVKTRHSALKSTENST